MLMTLPMPRHKLDVGFEHHDHSYKRTKKLKGGQPNVNGTLYLGIAKHQAPCTHTQPQPSFDSRVFVEQAMDALVCLARLPTQAAPIWRRPVLPSA